MKYLLILSTLLFVPIIFGQESEPEEKDNSNTLWVETNGVILQGTIDISTKPELFVGHEYYFTMFSNKGSFDLEIKSENLKVTLDEETKKSTGGLGFTVVPLDTGECSIMLSVGNDNKRVSSLILRPFHASVYPMPPVFISSIRSGELIHELTETAKISCEYGMEYGIYESYPIKSWKATFGNIEFSGTGTTLSKELIDAVNQAPTNDVLRLTVELGENKTGYTTSEAVFILK